MAARKPKQDDQDERDRGPGPDQAVMLVSVWEPPAEPPEED